MLLFHWRSFRQFNKQFLGSQSSSPREAGFAPVVNLIAGLIIAIGLGLTVYLIQQRTHVLPFAQDTGGTCQPPAAVTNVLVEYPSCQ